MSKTLQQILGAKNLCGVIEGIKPGLAADKLPPGLLNSTQKVEGNRCTYKKVEGTRKTARLVQYGGPSVTRGLSGVSEVPVVLAHTFEHVFHNPNVLHNLLNLQNETRQKLGMSEITRQTVEFKQLFTNLRVAAVMSAFLKGAVYFDVDGNLLPSSSNAVVSIDYGIPAGNKTQLDVLGAGSIIGASWATAGTAIHKHMTSLKAAARQLTGYPITQAMYGANVLDYFLGNTKLSAIINRNARYQDAFSQGEIADGFLGIKKWWPMEEAFFVDEDGDTQNLSTATQIVFFPDVSLEWYDLLEGSYAVPTDLGSVSADGVGALSNIMLKPGMFSYAHVISDPVTVKQFAGDTFPTSGRRYGWSIVRRSG